MPRLAAEHRDDPWMSAFYHGPLLEMIGTLTTLGEVPRL
jgi:hypothetical protein